jgi:hypothetical protein
MAWTGSVSWNLPLTCTLSDVPGGVQLPPGLAVHDDGRQQRRSFAELVQEIAVVVVAVGVVQVVG